MISAKSAMAEAIMAIAGRRMATVAISLEPPLINGALARIWPSQVKSYLILDVCTICIVNCAVVHFEVVVN